jgi:hypothetical protein
MYNHRIITAGIKEDILAICNHLGKDSKYYQDLRELVKQYDQKYQVFAAWLLVRGVEPDTYILQIQKYIESKRITNFSVSAKAVKINDEVFEDHVKLTEYIHENFPVLETEQKVDLSATPEDVAVAANTDGSIRIFEINSANDGRRLVGNDTPWCIGWEGPKNMWQSYRDSHEATFFVVFDSNPPTSDQRKVAIDFTRGNKVLLTDMPNRTGSTLSNGMDWDDYSKYLTENGIDLELTRKNPKTGKDEKIFTNKPMSEDEIIQSAAFSRILQLSVEDILVWQAEKIILPKDKSRIDYSNLEILEDTEDLLMVKYPGAKFFTSRWLGLGKKIEDEVLVYLLKSVGGEEIVSKYVNTGLKISNSQYQIIRQNKNILTSYLRSRINALSNYENFDDKYYFQDLINLKRRDLISLYFSKDINFTANQFEYLKTDPEILKIYIEKNMNTVKFNMDLLIDLNDRDITLKFLNSNKGVINTKLAEYIQNDKEFLITYIKNVLTRKLVVQIMSRSLMQDRILETEDRELIKEVAQKTPFISKHFKMAESLGFLNEVKYSIFADLVDESVFVFYDAKNAFDRELVNQVTNLQTLKDLYEINPDWISSPRVSMALDINNFEQIVKKEENYAYHQHFAEELVPNSPNQSLLLAIYSEGSFFNHFQSKDLSDENKDSFRKAYLDFGRAIKDINFWKNFAKELGAFETYIKNRQNPINFDKDDFSHILKFIPQQFLNDQEIQNFLEANMKEINYKDFVNNVNIKNVPWLYEKYIQQFKYSNTLLKKEFQEIISNQDYQFAYTVLEEAFKFQAVPVYIISEIDIPNNVAIHILDIFKNNAQGEELPFGGQLYHTKMLQNFVVNSTLGEQMYLLRNFPSFFEYQLKYNRDISFAKPEIRAALKEMYPQYAAYIEDKEKNQYSIIPDYYDEETQEVIQGRRPSVPEVKKELPDPFAADESEEKEEPTTAFVKSMVKIAQKLDLKKNYKLADKFINILRKYNV